MRAVHRFARGFMALVRRRSAKLAKRIAAAGSVAVIIAGAYWFFERVF